MEYLHLTITKDNMSALTDYEQRVFVTTMVVANELGTLMALLLQSYPVPDDASPTSQASKNQVYFLLLLVTGKLVEAWKMVQRDHIDNPEFDSLRNRLPSSARRALNKLEGHFGAGRPLTAMRNSFAFHYGAGYWKIWKRVDGDSSCQVWLPRQVGGARYDIGNVIAGTAVRTMDITWPKGSSSNRVDAFAIDVRTALIRMLKYLNGVLQTVFADVAHETTTQTIPNPTATRILPIVDVSSLPGAIVPD